MGRSEIGEWMPFEIDRFFGSPRVQKMRDFQKWWYVSLLLRAWQAQPPCHLPDDENELMILAGATSERSWKEHSALVLGAFRVTGDGHRVNDRQLEIYEEKIALRETNKVNGRLGGRPKKTETKPNGNRTVSEPSSSLSYSIVPVLEVGFELEDFDGEEFFEQIMEFWPHKDRSYQAKTALFEEVERICGTLKCGRSSAAKFVRKALEPIAEVIRSEYPQAKWKFYPLRNALKQYENGPESFRNSELMGSQKQQARNDGISKAFS